MQRQTEPEWAAFAAIDWGDQKHIWKLRPAEVTTEESGELQHTPEAVDAWAADLARRFGGRPVAVCLEQSRGALVYQLMQYPHLVLFPVAPTTSARFREALYPSGAKSDARDAGVLLTLLLRHRAQLRPLRPETEQTRHLQYLVEQRRRMVDEKTRCSNRLRACLKQYFPQVLDWFENIDEPLPCAFIEQWSTLSAVQHAHPGTLRKFFHKHNCRSEPLIETRIQRIYAATPATLDKAIVEAGRMQSRQLIALLEVLRRNISELEQVIAELFAQHEDAFLYTSLPGAGAALEPRLLVAMGTDRDRYQTVEQLQSYSGIAPVTQSSGKSEVVHFRYACPKFLRQTFQEFAKHSIHESEWARAFYQRQRATGKGFHAAVRALAYKWIRILFRCWKDRKPYDEARYLSSLQQRSSPLAQTQWKPVAGFQKLSTNLT
jgi:transposase